MSVLLSAAFRTDEFVSPADEFRTDVLRGLRAREKQLPCKYFYDAAGSQLFDQICDLPEYYPSRTELGILSQHAPAMAAMLGKGCLLLEYGSGSSTKTRALLDHMPLPAVYVPIDIAHDQLRSSSAALAQEYPAIEIHPLCGDFTRDIALPIPQTPIKRRVVYFPGSTIGNLLSHEAIGLLRRSARLCGARGGLLLGVDLKKDPGTLTAAYNDAAGLTAAFNTNLLARINRELGADFHLDRFWHHAFYNPAESRIEMHLVSDQDQAVRIAGQSIFIAEGESIRTEYSYKYSLRDLAALAAASGFRVERIWCDDRNYFTVQYWTASGSPDPHRTDGRDA